MGLFWMGKAQTRMGWWALKKEERHESAARAGTKDSVEAHSASLPTTGGAVRQSLVGSRCAGP